MKKLIKRSICVLISAVIVFSTAAYGFMSTAADSHYTDNIRWIDSTNTGLQQMWDNGETFIFVIYSSNLDLCRDIGTEVFEKYWMNEYGATIYGVDVFDIRCYGNPA